MNAIHRNPRRQRGLGLIEVLVAALVLSIGLLGIAGLNLMGMRNNHGAYMRSQATFLAQDILDRMRGNRDEALTNLAYNIAIGTTVSTLSTLAENDLDAWKDELVNLLPAGDGSVTCVTATGECVVVVQWQERVGSAEIDARIADSTATSTKADAVKRRFSVRTRI